MWSSKTKFAFPVSRFDELIQLYSIQLNFILRQMMNLNRIKISESVSHLLRFLSDQNNLHFVVKSTVVDIRLRRRCRIMMNFTNTVGLQL